MEDKDIITLYWNRNEQAILETANKYGRYCFKIAYNILVNNEDAEESVNDAYMKTWDCIPPHIPEMLSAFIGKITRHVSLDKWYFNHRQKRGGGQIVLALDELEECLASQHTVEHSIEEKELAQMLNAFLQTLPEKERDLFLCRYWFFASIQELCVKFGYSESKIKSMLFRTRKKLKKFLTEEGYL